MLAEEERPLFLGERGWVFAVDGCGDNRGKGLVSAFRQALDSHQATGVDEAVSLEKPQQTLQMEGVSCKFLRFSALLGRLLKIPSLCC